MADSLFGTQPAIPKPLFYKRYNDVAIDQEVLGITTLTRGFAVLLDLPAQLAGRIDRLH